MNLFSKVNFNWCIIAFVFGCMICFQTTSVYALEVEDGLVLYYNFEQIKGKTVKDELGKFDGDIKGSDLKSVPGKFSKALKFDEKGYVHVDKTDVIDFGNKDGYSVALWLKSSQNNKTIFSYGSGSEWEKHEKEMYIAKAGEPGSEGPNTGPVEIVGWGCDWIRGAKEDVVDDDKWHHVAITWDAVAKKGFVYTDGKEGTFEAGYNGCSDNKGNTLRLGFSESGFHSEPFSGLMDEVRFYNRPLTGKEVKTVMDDVSTGIKTPVDGADKLALTWATIKN